MNELIEIASVEDLSAMMTTRLGKPIDLSGGPLYLAKFVAAELEAWRAVHPDLPGLESVAYDDGLGGNTGLACSDGRILLNRTHFSTPDRLIGHITRTGLNHVIDEAPEFGAAFAVRHELTHTRGFAKSADHSFVPDILAVDRNRTKGATVSATKLVVASWAVGLITNEEAERSLAELLHPPEHPAFKEQPVLYALNEQTMGRHISPYGLTNKVEAFAEAGAKVAFAGAAAGEASLTLFGLAGPVDAEVAAAKGHVADLVELRRRLDPRTGLAADPESRDTEIAGGLVRQVARLGLLAVDIARAKETRTLPRDQIARPPSLMMSLLSDALRNEAEQDAGESTDGAPLSVASPHAPANKVASSPPNAASAAADPPRSAALPVAGATAGARPAGMAPAWSSTSPAAAQGFSGIGATATRCAGAGAAASGPATHAPRAAVPSVTPRAPAHARPTPAMPPANAAAPAPSAPTARPPEAKVARNQGLRTPVSDLSSYSVPAQGLNSAAESGACSSAPPPRGPVHARPTPATFRDTSPTPGLQRQVGDDRFL